MFTDVTVRCSPLSADDPDTFAVSRDATELGRFALRGLHDHGAGRRLAAAIGGPRQTRFPGPHGIVHDLAIAPACDLAAVEHVFAAIARRSLARLYGAVFFCSGDRSVAGVLRGLGVELPGELAATGVAPVIGVYQPGRADNLARLRALELGRAEISIAA